MDLHHISCGSSHSYFLMGSRQSRRLIFGIEASLRLRNPVRKTFWVWIIFGSEEIFDQKMLSWKNVRSKKNYGSEKFWVWKNLGLTKFRTKKVLGLKFFYIPYLSPLLCLEALEKFLVGWVVMGWGGPDQF